MPATRFVLGPSFNFLSKSAPPVPPPPTGKSDVSVSFLGLTKDGGGKDAVNVAIPAYDLAKCNQLAEVRVYLAPSGATLPADGPQYAASTLPFGTVDVAAHQEGVTACITLPEVPSGPNGTDLAYVGQVVLGMEA